ncbi:unnamed protein product [Rotaria sp. Silwood1]|nr:unnamed protein product [Rotaria sp. Silwood1]
MSVIISNRPKSQINILDKRIPRNPKYENIKATIDTGGSLTKFVKRNEELRGCLKYAAKKFPHGLITGKCPLSWTLSSISATSIKKLTRAQSMNILHSEAPLGQSAITLTRPSLGPMIAFDIREQFTNHDIEALNTQLEGNLLPKDSGTRLSCAHTQASKQCSRMSNVSERSNLSNVSDKPWKP